MKSTKTGLMLLKRKHSGDITADTELLADYYENKLSPAFSYIFSLGAPIPKELANIKTVFPYFISVQNATRDDILGILADQDQTEQLEIIHEDFEMFRGGTYYVIHRKNLLVRHVEAFIREQVFAREFKAQLHRYLNLHRIIWENIADVKERGNIKGTDIKAFKTKIDGYEKTINLISSRIAQMGSYIKTRGSIAKSDDNHAPFKGVIAYKYDTLADTLAYVKEIWKMTAGYVHSAQKIFGDLQSKATNNSIKSLTVVTAMGVGGTLIGLFGKKLPDFGSEGILYFAIVVAVGIIASKIMGYIGTHKQYTIKDIDADRDIHFEGGQQ